MRNSAKDFKTFILFESSTLIANGVPVSIAKFLHKAGYLPHDAKIEQISSKEALRRVTEVKKEAEGAFTGIKDGVSIDNKFANFGLLLIANDQKNPNYLFSQVTVNSAKDIQYSVVEFKYEASSNSGYRAMQKTLYSQSVIAKLLANEIIPGTKGKPKYSAYWLDYKDYDKTKNKRAKRTIIRPIEKIDNEMFASSRFIQYFFNQYPRYEAIALSQADKLEKKIRDKVANLPIDDLIPLPGEIKDLVIRFKRLKEKGVYEVGGKLVIEGTTKDWINREYLEFLKYLSTKHKGEYETEKGTSLAKIQDVVKKNSLFRTGYMFLEFLIYNKVTRPYDDLLKDLGLDNFTV